MLTAAVLAVPARARRRRRIIAVTTASVTAASLGVSLVHLAPTAPAATLEVSSLASHLVVFSVPLKKHSKKSSDDSDDDAAGADNDSEGPVAAAARQSTSTGSAGTGPVDGLWETDGYGWIFEVSGGHAKLYEATTVSCMMTGDYTLIGNADAGGTSFGTKGASADIIRNLGNGRGSLRPDGTAAEIDMFRLNSLPGMCTKPTANDPVTNFNVFWASFRDNYNSTVRKGLNWDQLKSTYGPQVTASTTPQQLYQILVKMVTPLGDAHIELTPPKTVAADEFEGYRTGTRYTDNPADGGINDDAAWKAVDTYLASIGAGKLTKWSDDIAYCDLPGNRGYLRFTDFDGWDTTPDNFEGRNALLTQVMNTVFSAQHVQSWKNLIIDVRYNDGGDDQLTLNLAGRMTDKPYLAYNKMARDNPSDPTKYTRAHPVMVAPSTTGPRYTGPVTILAADTTMSAGETFIEAMMGRTPGISLVGMTTQGVYADNMDRKLPNGWTFTVGNEDYVAANGKNYEDTGIPPTVPVPVWTKTDLTGKTDGALAYALRASPQ